MLIYHFFKPNPNPKLTFLESHIWADLNPDIRMWRLRRANTVRPSSSTGQSFRTTKGRHVGPTHPSKKRQTSDNDRPRLSSNHANFTKTPKISFYSQNAINGLRSKRGGIGEIEKKSVSIFVNK